MIKRPVAFRYLDDSGRFAFTASEEEAAEGGREYQGLYTRDGEPTENERLRAALNEIAAYDDRAASEYLVKHGSYAWFDEPGSVKIARAALNR